MTNLALLTLALGGPARAQATNPNNWTVTDANGNPSPPNYNGGWLLSGPVTGTTTPTGVYQQMQSDLADWGSFTPFASPASSALASVLSLDSNAIDAGRDPTIPSWEWGFFENVYGGSYFYHGSFISGGVSASADSAPSAILTYHPLSGDTPTPPDHIDLLLTTTLETHAETSYADINSIVADELSMDQFMGKDTSGLDTSGLLAQMPSLAASVTARDTLGDQLSASTSSQDADFDSDNCNFSSNVDKTVVGRHLVRVPVLGGVGTVSVGGHIETSVSNDSSNFVDLWGWYMGTESWAHADISTVAQFISAAAISLSGTTFDISGNQNILIGQGCTAWVDLPNLPPGVTAGPPTWTVSGNPYIAFNISSQSQDKATGQAVQTTGQAVAFSSPTTAQSISFYWAWCTPSETVQASIPLAYTPPGSNVSQPIGNLTTQRPVTVWYPGVAYNPTGPMANGIPALGTVGLTDSSVISNAAFGLNAATGLDFGIELQIDVVTPDDFISSMANLTGEKSSPNGTWAWLQLCQLVDTAGGSNAMTSYELDSAFPFNTAGTKNNADVPGIAYDCDTMDNHHGYVLFTDTPENPWNAYTTTFAFNNSYQLYAMYMPPNIGWGANWVPLEMWQWGFNANMSRSTGVSSDWTPFPPGSMTFSGSAMFPPYPQWNAEYGSAN